MRLDASKVAAALRRRFPGPQGPRRALRVLGLDADLLAPDVGKSDAAKALRSDIEELFGELNLGEIEMGKLLSVLDQHAPLDTLPDNHPQRERARDLASDDRLEKVKTLLRAAGLVEVDIAEALRLANVGARDYSPEQGASDGVGMDAAATAMNFEARHAELVGRIGGREIPFGRRQIAYDAATFAKRHPEIALLIT